MSVAQQCQPPLCDLRRLTCEGKISQEVIMTFVGNIGKDFERNPEKKLLAPVGALRRRAAYSISSV